MIDYKEKYEQAIERAKNFIENGDERERTIAESIFAGIMEESEDERIRKYILSHFQGHLNTVQEFISKGVISPFSGEEIKMLKASVAWIKKQGESNPYSGVSFEYNGNIWGMCARDNGVDILLDKQLFKHLEKQGEEIIPLKEIILNVWELGNYWKELTKGVCNTEHGRQLDYIVKHWKEGEHYIKSFEKKGEQAKEATYTHEAVTGNGNIKALVTEKVQLPKFKVGDTIRPKGSLAEYTIESISGECYHGKGWGLAISGDNEYELVRHKPVFEMKTPKESLGIDSDTYSKIVDECVYGEQKPVWSKQDETLLNCCLGAINTTDYFDKDNKDEMKNWLNHLKERVQFQSQWKPTDEQMEYLAKAITTLGDEGNCKTASILNDLRVELKKLRGE